MCNKVIFYLLFTTFELVYLQKGSYQETVFENEVLPYWEGSNNNLSVESWHRKSQQKYKMLPRRAHPDVMPWMLRIYKGSRNAARTGEYLPTLNFLTRSPEKDLRLLRARNRQHRRIALTYNDLSMEHRRAASGKDGFEDKDIMPRNIHLYEEESTPRNIFHYHEDKVPRSYLYNNQDNTPESILHFTKENIYVNYTHYDLYDKSRNFDYHEQNTMPSSILHYNKDNTPKRFSHHNKKKATKRILRHNKEIRLSSFPHYSKYNMHKSYPHLSKSYTPKGFFRYNKYKPPRFFYHYTRNKTVTPRTVQHYNKYNSSTSISHYNNYITPTSVLLFSDDPIISDLLYYVKSTTPGSVPRYDNRTTQGTTVPVQNNLKVRTELRRIQQIYTLDTRPNPPVMYLRQNDEDEDEKPTSIKYSAEAAESPEYDPNDFLRPQAIKSIVENIASLDPELNITVEVIGRTSAFNDIVLMKISESNKKYFRSDDKNIFVDEPPEKKTIFIVHGLNVQGMKELQCLSHPKNLTKLLDYYYKHLDKFDIFLMPLANPDGYSYSRTNPIWNKNLSPQQACPGVALDRNFDISWPTKSSLSSCSQYYPGESAFSEPESQAIRSILHDYNHKIVAYINVHASSLDEDVYKGDAILYPRGYTETTSDEDKYVDLKGEIEEMMKNASFQVISVTVDTLYNWYGTVKGTSVDYASVVYGIPYAMEFLMQNYKDSPNFKPTTRKSYAEIALQEIWQKIINAVFENIYKNTKNDAAKRKK